METNSLIISDSITMVSMTFSVELEKNPIIKIGVVDVLSVGERDLFMNLIVGYINTCLK